MKNTVFDLSGKTIVIVGDGRKLGQRWKQLLRVEATTTICTDIEDKVKVKLRKEYGMLNPAELKRKITKLQNKLLELNILKQKAREELDNIAKPLSSLEYIST